MAKTAVTKKAATRKPAAKAKSAAKPAAKKKPAAKAAAKAAPKRKPAAKAPARAKPTARAKPAAKKPAVKKPAAKKPAAKKPSARGSAAKLKVRAAPRQVAPARPATPPQSFMVSHYKEGDFHRDGFRPYNLYRELGVAEATGGLAQAHVARPIPPCKPEEVSKLHYHAVDFQLVYVLRGWIKNEFEGHGEQFMRAGSCWIQPPGIKHKVLDYSDDCEVLEIILPAQYDTVTFD